MGQPLVSVIIAAHNAEEWIRETVQSALQQSYSPLEIITVDDLSRDATWSILEEFRPKITALRNERNMGVSASRNRAIAAAKGDYIALLDHDDLWYPQKIERQMDLFKERPDLGLVFSDCFYQTNKGDRWRSFQATPPSKGHVFHELLLENFIPCVTAVMSRKTLHATKLFREDLAVVEDHELFLRIAQRYPIDYIDEPLAIYRIHDRNFTRHKAIYHRERIIVQSLYENVAPLKGEITLHEIGLAIALFRDVQIGKALWVFAQAFFHLFKHPILFIKACVKTRERRNRVRL